MFLDAGNIWLKHEDRYRPGSQFTGKFLNQLAIGGGVGLRVDITLFVIRLDVAYPLRTPWKLPSGEQKRPIFNLAIGYPF